LFNSSRNSRTGSVFGGRQGGYDQSDLPDVIILLKVIVSLFDY